MGTRAAFIYILLDHIILYKLHSWIMMKIILLDPGGIDADDRDTVLSKQECHH